MRNPFYLSDIEGERSLNTDVLNKIPESLTQLEFEGSFYGSIERNIISKRLPLLTYFHVGRGGGVQFNQDTRPANGIENSLGVVANAGSDSFRLDVQRSNIL